MQKRLLHVGVPSIVAAISNTVQFTADDQLMVQERRKQWLILLDQNKRTQSVRTIEELLVEFVLQTCKFYFHNTILQKYC